MRGFTWCYAAPGMGYTRRGRAAIESPNNGLETGEDGGQMTARVVNMMYEASKDHRGQGWDN